MPMIVEIVDFQEDVVLASNHVPVLVDIWAEWCMPCKSLMLVLEDLVEEGDGAFHLARLDVGEHRQLAAALGVEGLPAIKLYRGGEAVDGLAGTIAKMQVKALLTRHLPGWNSAGGAS